MIQFDSTLVDIAIGTVCVILLFSILHSGLIELIQVYLRTRNHFLMERLDQVFNDRTNLNLCDMIFNHPFVKFTRPRSQTLPAYISSGFFADALIDILHRTSLTPPTDETGAVEPLPGSEEPVLDAIRIHTGQLKHSPVKVLLQSLLLQSKTLPDFRTALCGWYDGHMERVSSQYKRKLMKWSMLLGIVIAVAANANLIVVMQSISKDSALRNALVMQAETMSREHEANKTQDVNASADGQANDAEAIRAKIDTTVRTIRDLGLPIGWDNRSEESGVITPWYTRNFRDLSFPLVILGWILMGAAMSFGSDYWFNLLSKFFQLRGVLKPAKEEEKK